MSEAMERVLARFEGHARSGPEGWKVLCPCHPDRLPSLSIDPGEGGRVLLKCRAGCDIKDIMKEAGLTWGDLQGDGRPVEGAAPRPRARELTEEDRVLRDLVYRQLSKLLGLTDADRKALYARGLTDAEMADDRYASLGARRNRVAGKALVAEFGKDALLKVPGFFMDGEAADLTLKAGVLIPVTDVKGRITACQVRTGDRGGKYVWLSGPQVSSGTPPHVVQSGHQLEDELIITEGPLKANVVFWRWSPSTQVVGIPGAANWRDALPAIKELAPKVLVGYDQDWRTKPVVRAQLDALTATLRAGGRDVRWLDWDGTKAKGLDDALVAGLDVTRIDPLPPEGLVETETSATGVPDVTAQPAPNQGAPVAEEQKDRFRGRQIVGIEAAEVQTLQTDWLWHKVIPLGGITMLDGDPGLGKSTMTCNLAAACTTGGPLPNDPGREPGGVVILSAEDDIARTFVPRLRAAGADLTRIKFAVGMRKGPKGDELLLTLPDDVDLLEVMCIEKKAKLLVIDPLYAFFSESIDSHKDAHVRRVLHSLDKMAKRLQLAVLAVRHLNKDATKSSLYRGSGSIGVIGQARSGLMFIKDPKREGYRRIVVHVKHNLSEGAEPQECEIVLAGDSTRLVWHGPSELTVKELEGRVTDRDVTFRNQWLIMQLVKGPRPSSEILEKAKDEFGWTKDQLRASREDLGIKTDQRGRAWWWELGPSPVPTEEKQDGGRKGKQKEG